MIQSIILWSAVGLSGLALFVGTLMAIVDPEAARKSKPKSGWMILAQSLSGILFLYVALVAVGVIG